MTDFEKEEGMFEFQSDRFRVKVGLAEMLKGGVIMDVTTAAQAKIAEGHCHCRITSATACSEACSR